MTTKITSVTNANGIPFNVMLVEKGDLYGLNNCLTHVGIMPMVEFYDARFPHTERGQFVSRYYLNSLLERPSGGLTLDFGVPDWALDANAFAQVVAALEPLIFAAPEADHE